MSERELTEQLVIRTEQLVIRVNKQTRSDLEELASDNDRTIAQEVRRAIRLHIERERS